MLIALSLHNLRNPPTNRYDNEKLHFKGNGGTDKKDYELTLNFYGKVKGDESKHIIRERGVEFVFYKEADGWWPRLLSENKKVHWLKVDFNKWKDEDDSGDEGSNFNEKSYEEMMMSQLGGGGGADFGNFNIDGADGAEEEDEDDAEEPLPDLE